MSQPGALRNALQVSPLRISKLSDVELNELMGHLLRAQSYRCDCRDAYVNAQVDARDEGCDGWSEQPAKADRWLGDADTCWQFKAGRQGEPARLADEVDKPIPRRTLEQGGRFVLVASGSTRGLSGADVRRNELVAQARKAGLPTDKIEVYGSEKLAEWCNQHPAVAARWTDAPEGLWTFDDWANSAEHQIRYQASRRIKSDLSRARAQLDFGTSNEAEERRTVSGGTIPWPYGYCAAWRAVPIYLAGAAGTLSGSCRAGNLSGPAEVTARKAPVGVSERGVLQATGVDCQPSGRTGVLARPIASLFFRIDDFVEPHAARRWSAISTADPDLAARNLRRALSSSSTDDRRRIAFPALGEIVWRLARIASRTSGFHDAATALALLAEPENESWGNGASREFVTKYHVSLGGTALPYLQRLDVLDELMELPRPGLRRLVVRALAQVGDDSAGGVVMPSSDQVPEPDWQPHSREEFLRCIEAGIDRLRSIAAERDPALQADLLAAAKDLSWLLRYRDAGSSVATFLVRLCDAYPELREPIRQQIADVLRRNGENLVPERRETLDRLHARFEDPSLEGRLRQYVGPHEWEREAQPDLASLAAELLVDRQALSGQWPWLTSGRAGAAWQLGEALAASDPGGSLAEELPRLPGGGPDQRVVCGYVAARRSVLGDAWYEQWVTALFDHDPLPVELLLEVVWRCGATDRLARRTAQLLRSGNPSRASVGQLKYAGWLDTGDAALETMLRAMMETGHRETAVSILQRRMESAAAEVASWQQLAMDLVLDLDLIRCKKMPNHHWHKLAKMMAPYHPCEIASAIFQAHSRHDGSDRWLLRYQREVVEVLLACIEHAPGEVWDALRRHLWPPREAMFFVIGFPAQVLERLPPRPVLEWIAEPPAEQSAQRAALLASLTNKQRLTDESLAARIIAQYGGDEDVSDAFFSHHVSGGGAGPLSVQWRDKAHALSAIAERTALPGLRTWANRSAAGLHSMAYQWQQKEEERSLLLR